MRRKRGTDEAALEIRKALERKNIEDVRIGAPRTSLQEF